MRHVLLLTLLMLGTGCNCVRDRVHGRKGCPIAEEVVCAEKKPLPVQAPPKPVETIGAPRLEEQAVQTAMAQEVLLVPRTVYMPFVAANPTQPMRMSTGVPISPGRPVDNLGSPPPPAGPGEEDFRTLIDTCRKLQDRCAQLEKSLAERSAPVVVCPPAAPPCPPPLLSPFIRRPLFQRSEPLLRRDIPCDNMQQCDPLIVPHPPKHEAIPLPKNAPTPILTIQ